MCMSCFFLIYNHNKKSYVRVYIPEQLAALNETDERLPELAVHEAIGDRIAAG